MKPEILEPSLKSLDTLEGYDSICLLLTEDERPLQGAAGFLDWRMCGALSRVITTGFFTGTPGERLLVPTDGRVKVPRVFAVGLGPSKGVTPLGLEHALKAANGTLHKAQSTSAVLALPVLKLEEKAFVGIVQRAFCDAFTGSRVGVFADATLKSRLEA